MADPFLGEIRPLSFNFAPRFWAMCSGQILSIAQNQALFSLLGTNYGGNGQTNFALPDLRGRVAISAGTGPGLSPKVLGEKSGAEAITLTANEIPAHRHRVNVSNTATSGTPVSNLPGSTSGNLVYGPQGGETLASDALMSVGGSQAHENRQPFLTITYAICLAGIFPPHN